MSGISGLERSRPAPVLARDNWERWFKLLRTHFQSKELHYVLVGTGTIKPSDEAAVQYTILQCIGTFDEEEIESYGTAKEKWNALWKKYSKTNHASNRHHLRELH